MTSLLLIRHCASSGQTPEAELTATGHQAATELVSRLRELAPDAIYSSPYRRALSTIAPFAAHAALTVHEDARLRERELAAPADDWLTHVRLSYDDHAYRLPGGESFHEARTRALAALAEIAQAAHRLPVVVSHGNLLSAILSAADASFGFERWRAMRTPDLFLLRHEGGRPISFEQLA